jgi:hypothetical protein
MLIFELQNYGLFFYQQNFQPVIFLITVSKRISMITRLMRMNRFFSRSFNKSVLFMYFCSTNLHACIKKTSI